MGLEFVLHCRRLAVENAVMRDTSASDWRYVNNFISFNNPLRIGACATVVRSAVWVVGPGVIRFTLNRAPGHGCFRALVL